MMPLYISYVSLGLALLLIVLSSLSGHFKFRRLILTGMFIVVLTASFIVLSDLLSRPKPVEIFWNAPDTEKAYVLGYWLKENEGIYVLLLVPEFPEPRYYKYPWSVNLAEKLQKIQGEALRRGQKAFIWKFPFENTLNTKDAPIYAIPPPVLPPKIPANTEVIPIK